MSDMSGPTLTLRTPPRYGRRAVWSILAALGLFGLSFAIDAAAANQVGYSEMPAIWARYLSAVALYYAAICAYRWFRRQRCCSRRAGRKNAKNAIIPACENPRN